MYYDVDIGHDLKMAFEDGYQDGVEAAQPKWISVEERLPDQPGQVLIAMHGYVGIAWYNDYCFEFGSGVKFAVDYPNAHWMPMPQPPKDEP